MQDRETASLPARLARLQQRFERSRAMRRPHSPIPDSLWTAAVKAASIFGVNRTARTLRVNYYALKKRLQQGEAVVNAPSENAATATFIELATPVSAAPCPCTVELENAHGAKMRILLTSVSMSDVAAFSREFCNQSR
jgi:hypothetical protein